MASFNQVIIVGNLTRDPELRVTPKGTQTCQFGIAVNREFKDDSGQKREEVTFVDCEAWAKQAEVIAKYLTKGRQVLVQGRLKLDQWEDKQSGEKRSKLKVVVENVQFIGSAREGGEAADRPAQQPQPRQPRPQAAPAPKADETEDIPF